MRFARILSNAHRDAGMKPEISVIKTVSTADSYNWACISTLVWHIIFWLRIKRQIGEGFPQAQEEPDWATEGRTGTGWEPLARLEAVIS
jgi:hypothetical protein